MSLLISVLLLIADVLIQQHRHTYAPLKRWEQRLAALEQKAFLGEDS